MRPHSVVGVLFGYALILLGLVDGLTVLWVLTEALVFDATPLGNVIVASMMSGGVALIFLLVGAGLVSRFKHPRPA